MTTLSLNFRQAAYAQETGRVIIALITLEHDGLSDPIRISSDPTQRLPAYTTDEDVVYGTVSRGNNYLFLPMRLSFPDDKEEGPGEMKIEIDNVHRTYVEAIRSIATPPTVTVEVVVDNALDTVELQWPEFLLTNIEYDATMIKGTLRMETLESEPFPSGSFSPSYFPGLF